MKPAATSPAFGPLIAASCLFPLALAIFPGAPASAPSAAAPAAATAAVSSIAAAPIDGDTLDAAIGPGPVVVHSAFGGFILGYDVDETGNEGLLTEAFTLPSGKHDVAVETFDQRTGVIVKIVAQQLDSLNDYIALGIVGSHVGLVEFEHVSGLFVDNRTYATLEPVDGNTINDRWTPPLTTNDLILGIGRTQGKPLAAVMGFHNGSFQTFVFGSDVGANTFQPLFTLTDSNFDPGHSPVIALDDVQGRAVIGAQGPNAFGPPRFALVDLATGAMDNFTGIGIGYVNGIAVDAATQVACTATEIDFRVQFYDLATHIGFPVVLPGAVSQFHSGKEVQVDTLHKLFLVAQPNSSTAPGASSIQVFTEQGQFVESINGLHLPASPVRIAIKPSRRSGFVIVAPDLSSLQSFTY